MNVIEIPGSKSYTNRALIMAALTDNPVLIKNPLESDDTEAMIECLQTLGISIQKKGKDIEVAGSIKDVKDSMYDLNARLSGTTIRFILALSCIVPGTKIIHGEGRLNERPIKDLVSGLNQLGADISYRYLEGFPPLEVKSSKLTHHSVRMNGNVSSQYFSALLMISPIIGGITIQVEGDQISKSYIDMTNAMMKEWGITPEHQKYEMKEYIVEGDYSGAGYFFAIAALNKIDIRLKNLNPNSKQGDKQFVHILEKMGNTVSFGDHEVTIHGKNTQPISVNMEQCPDQAQTLAVMAAFADGVTKMTGVRSLRVKETERVKAVQNELSKMDIRTESPDDDTLIIHGGNPKAATIDTYGDHRMAMSFAVAQTKLKDLKINNPEVVNKTFPGFWETLKQITV